MHRYWIIFEGSMHEKYRCHNGCGVTAETYEAALEMVKRELFKDLPMPKVHEVIVDIDVSTLEANHVRPNIGVPVRRGIWFPNINLN